MLTTGLEDKFFDFGKQKHAEDFAKNCEEITKYVSVNYKNGGPEMSIAIKKTEKPTIKMSDVRGPRRHIQ